MTTWRNYSVIRRESDWLLNAREYSKPSNHRSLHVSQQRSTLLTFWSIGEVQKTLQLLLYKNWVVKERDVIFGFTQ